MFTTLIIIVCISLFIAGIAVSLVIQNDKRSKEMKLEIGDEVIFDKPIECIGKVIEDKGENVKIEIELPRHLIYKK